MGWMVICPCVTKCHSENAGQVTLDLGMAAGTPARLKSVMTEVA